jgi:hypothetical protein
MKTWVGWLIAGVMLVMLGGAVWFAMTFRAADDADEEPDAQVLSEPPVEVEVVPGGKKLQQVGQRPRGSGFVPVHLRPQEQIGRSFAEGDGAQRATLP